MPPGRCVPLRVLRLQPRHRGLPAEQAVSEGVTLSGAKAAYAGINPKTTNNDNGIEFDQLSLSVAGDEYNSVGLSLPDSVLVDQPIATNWHAKAADAVPFAD